jgi:poly-beta-1,6-N-acetyl-D-glucosamine synthase
MILVIFAISLFLLLYTWVGYYYVLYGLARVLPNMRPKFGDSGFGPPVTILIPAYNEEDVIEKRIQNLLSVRYPKDQMEILIGSDGSTDRTVEIAEKYSNRGITVVSFLENRGRADVHNDLVKAARGEILIFSDADTIFDISFVERIVAPFSNPKIGAAVGKLCYRIRGGVLAENEGLYWKYELKIRELEDRLGILNNGTGACMAMRKELFGFLSPVEDIDTATIIDILFKGFKVVYVPEAVAYDIPPHSAKSEFKMRIRGTSKTLSSIKQRGNILIWLKNPVISWAICSHRLLRYFSAYLMAILFLTNVFLLNCGAFYKSIFAIQILFYLLAIVGWIGDRLKTKIFVASSLYSFCVAMLGMMIGVGRALAGKVKVTYKTDDTFV